LSASLRVALFWTERVENPEALAQFFNMNLHFEPARGGFDVDLGNPRRVQAAIQLAMAFEKAMSLFQIKAYDGAVNLLLSTDNLSRKKWGDSPKLKSCFSGDMRTSEIGRRHGEILDIRNRAFARRLTDCLQQAHEPAALPVNANLIAS
jgi:hypothetical protein